MDRHIDDMRTRTGARYDTVIALSEGLELRMVAGPGYKHNISRARLHHYRITSPRLRGWMLADEPPTYP